MYRISQDIIQPKIDVKDKKILDLLSENSRMALTAIARKVRLSKDTVNYRIKRMQRLGVILQFYPEIDFKKLGYNLYHVFVLIDERDKEKQEKLIDRMRKHQNTVNIMEYSDKWDLEWIFIATRIKEFEAILAEVCSDLSDIIIERSKMAVIDTFHSQLLPYNYYEKISKAKIDYNPDEKDFNIIHAMGNNCRASTYEISKKVDLSADAIGLRIKKLVNAGIIKRFTILPNLSALGYSWYTFGMQMKIFTKESEMKFKEFVRPHPYITSAMKILGEWDLLVYIIADSPKKFHKTIKQLKTEFSNTLKNYATFITYKENIFNAVPRIIKLNNEKILLTQNKL